MARKRSATIVNLAVERGRRRLHDYEARIRSVLDQNRGALSRLFSSGSIFTRRGTRTGRDLLLAHQQLLRVTDLFARLEELVAAPKSDPSEVDGLYRELDDLLEKTTALTLRTSARVGANHE